MTKQTRRSTSPIQQNSTCPIKKSRGFNENDVSIEARLLHSSGLASLVRGNNNEARRYFLSALGLLKSKNSPTSGNLIYTHELRDSTTDVPIPVMGVVDPLLLTASLALLDNAPELNDGVSICVGIRHDMALSYMKDNNHVEAKKWLELAVAEAIHTPFTLKNIFLCLSIYRSLGECLQKTDDLNGALLNYCRLCRLQLSLFGSNSLSVANTLSLVGRIQFIKNRSDDAIQLLEEALRIQQLFFGDDDICVSNTLNEIGIVLFGEGTTPMFAQAVKFFVKSLEIRQKLNGAMEKGTAILLFNLGTTYLEIGEEDLSIESFQRALKVEQCNGSNPQSIIKLEELLGLIFQKRGELNRALQPLERALHIAKEAYLPLVAGRMLNLMGNIHLRQANVGQMMLCFIEASRIFRNIPNQAGALTINGYGYYCLAKRHPECAPVA